MCDFFPFEPGGGGPERLGPSPVAACYVTFVTRHAERRAGIRTSARDLCRERWPLPERESLRALPRGGGSPPARSPARAPLPPLPQGFSGGPPERRKEKKKVPPGAARRRGGKLATEKLRGRGGKPWTPSGAPEPRANPVHASPARVAGAANTNVFRPIPMYSGRSTRICPPCPPSPRRRGSCCGCPARTSDLRGRALPPRQGARGPGPRGKKEANLRGGQPAWEEARAI